MDKAQKDIILEQMNAAIAAGNVEQARELMVKTQYPVPLSVAEAAKEALGIEFLLESGLNLSEAVAVYGQDWLTS
jgi:hypothetical protein